MLEDALVVLGNQVALTREKKKNGSDGFFFLLWVFPGISCLLKINKRKFRQEMFSRGGLVEN